MKDGKRARCFHRGRQVSRLVLGLSFQVLFLLHLPHVLMMLFCHLSYAFGVALSFLMEHHSRHSVTSQTIKQMWSPQSMGYLENFVTEEPRDPITLDRSG